MREVVLDTETTGLSASNGHRIIDIGCVEIINGTITGRTFQTYLNPQRDIDIAAQKVHGLTREFLSTHPTFAQKAPELLEFLQDATLVIHNAPFDMGFLNAELKLLGQGHLSHSVVDTLIMARKRFPGSPANLDALCKRFAIVGAHQRVHHGALIDAQLLASVYIAMSIPATLQFQDTTVEKQPLGVRPQRTARTFSLHGILEK